MSLKQIEELIGRELPEELKTYFSVDYEKNVGFSYSFPIKEPSPFGEAVVDELFVPSAEYLASDEFLESGMLCIGNNIFGNGVFLSIKDDDFGFVYYWDHEHRCFWEDEMFYNMFPNLDENIIRYLESRKKGKLPDKVAGYESFYLAGESITEFLSSLSSIEY
ncbi:SMI1/KNR4 family protein [Aliikangiella sp. G2MR2-5]|uniref:SMI1/KNR4 family protein n=1 Tax=Aliikangiella sp. G2MR2-5 TaxID=2788943 RepID=UPI0018A9DE0E|nr:SMI1/KNR4 family protein [Aliikangiella sp. G2MR2-5]